jgi:hypothetical protein
VSGISPNLEAVQKFCKVAYAEKINQKGYPRRLIEFEPKHDASDQLKATYLAVMVIDDMVMDIFGSPIGFEEYMDPRHMQYTNKQSEILALRLVFHNLHTFQQYHEAEITGSTVKVSEERYELFTGWCREAFPEQKI